MGFVWLINATNPGSGPVVGASISAAVKLPFANGHRRVAVLAEFA